MTSAQAAESALRGLAAPRELAVDVEADAMHAFRARLCFVQVGTDEGVWLFDTLAPGVSASALASVFADPARVKFFHAAGGDLEFLAEAHVRVHNLFDTHRAATLLGWPKVGLADLARELLGVTLAKEHQQSDFSLRPLPEEMRAYIANDVRYLCEIGRRVQAACRTADIFEEVALDCRRMADEASERPDLLAQFRPKLPKGPLSPQGRALATAMARELHRLRLQWAEAADVPMGRMLSNAAIAALIAKPPATLKDLARAEGVRGPFVREHGAEVLERLAALAHQAKDGTLPAADEEPVDRDPKRRKRADALKAFRSEKAAERKVTPSVVLPNALIDSLAHEPPHGLDALKAVPYIGEKRVALYGDALLRLLQ